MGDDLALKLVKSIPADKKCCNHTSAFVLASPEHPYHVVTGAWPGPNACGMSFGVHENGTLDQVIDTWSYAAKSGVHGLAFGDAASGLVHSADLNGDAIWTHMINPKDGRAKRVGRLAVKAGSHPRHLASHPNGKHLYAVMEAGNRVAAYSLDETTKAANEEESTYSLIPAGM